MNFLYDKLTPNIPLFISFKYLGPYVYCRISNHCYKQNILSGFGNNVYGYHLSRFLDLTNIPNCSSIVLHVAPSYCLVSQSLPPGNISFVLNTGTSIPQFDNTRQYASSSKTHFLPYFHYVLSLLKLYGISAPLSNYRFFISESKGELNQSYKNHLYNPPILTCSTRSLQRCCSFLNSSRA